MKFLLPLSIALCLVACATDEATRSTDSEVEISRSICKPNDMDAVRCRRFNRNQFEIRQP